jgi:cytosine deaminase
MCTGACILYKVKRVVVGENKNFLGGEQHLQSRGIEVVVLQNEECIKLMETFIQEKPQLWYDLWPTCLHITPN